MAAYRKRGLALVATLALAGTGMMSVAAIADPRCAEQVEPQRSWCMAEGTMHRACNVDIDMNSLCLAAPSLRLPGLGQVASRLTGPGATVPIPRGRSYSLLSAGCRAGACRSALGFALMKMSTGHCPGSGNPPFCDGPGSSSDRPDGVRISQPIVLIAFGDTRLTDIEGTRIEFLEEQSGGDSPCKGDLRAGEFRELTDAPRTGFTAVSDISRIYPREEFTVLARTAARDAYLVRSRHDFTGWLSARDIVLFSDTCEGRDWTTPVVDGGYLVAERERPHVIKRAYRMTMRNTELSTPDVAFADLQRARGYPTSGLLVLNPTDQKVAMEINGIEILLASSMYLRDVNGVTTILVLEGQVNATRNGRQFSGRAGQTLWIGPGGENLDTLMRRVPLPARQQVAAPWCGWLERIAKAAFRDRVPPAQIAFCAYAPQSYGYVPFFPGRVIDRPSGNFVDTPGPIITPPDETPDDPIEPSPERLRVVPG